ncbi:MAG: aminotransferase class I/II-fold pyridoxal phosphate-dependent enzyme [Pseudomonadota bacterium]
MSSDVEPFRAIGLSQLARQLRQEGRDVIQMEFGQPSAGAPTLAVDAAKSALEATLPGYWQSEDLKDRLAALYRDEHGVSVDPSRIFLTCGASPALVLALTCAFKPGDRIAMARPGYVAYRNTLKGLFLEPVEIRTGAETRFQLTAEMIAALQPAPQGVIIASPSNPTGAIIPPGDFAEIASVCERRGIRIISDEIYHQLTYGTPTVSALRYAPDAFVINSFSKYYCMPGWRVGWMVAPEDKQVAAASRIGNFFLTSPSLSQVAALAALDAKEELDGHLTLYAHNRDIMLERLPRLGLSEMAPPDGAFYIYANVGRYTDDSLAFCEHILRETGVVLAPGVDHDPDLGRSHVRFCFAMETGRINAALDRLETVLKP